MKRCAPLLLLVATWAAGQACMSPDGTQCLYLAPMLGANTCPEAWTPVRSCPTLPGFCYDLATGSCRPVPSIFGSTCDPPLRWSEVPCPPPPTPTPGPPPPLVPVPVSWDPWMRTPCFRAPPGMLPPYFQQCYETDFWSVEIANVPPGEALFGAGSTPAGGWAVSLYVSNDNEPPPAVPELRWCGIAFMTAASAETSQDLWLFGRFTWGGGFTSAGEAYATAMVVALNPENGWLYELDVSYAGRITGDGDPRPEYIVAPQPYPNGLNAWVVLDGARLGLGLGLNADGYGAVSLPVTALLEKVSVENPETFPAPSGGWCSAGLVYYFGVGVETFEASWGALGITELTLWAGDPSEANHMRRHLEKAPAP